MAKKYSGPYGNYEAGSIGALMNALCDQERLPTTAVDYFTFSSAGLRPGTIRKKGTGEIIGNYIWVGDYVFFEWLNTYKFSYWAVDNNGVHYLHPKLGLVNNQLEFEITADMLPYEDEYEKQKCFTEIARWFNVRTVAKPAIKLEISHSDMKMLVTVPTNSDIKEAVKEFDHFNGFRYQSSVDTNKWLHSFSEATEQKAIEMFRVFSRAINSMPNQNYCHDFKNLETRMRLAWLELAYHELNLKD